MTFDIVIIGIFLPPPVTLQRKNLPLIIEQVPQTGIGRRKCFPYHFDLKFEFNCILEYTLLLA